MNTPADATKLFTVNGCLRALAFCLSRSRFSVIILMAGLAILLTDQGCDLLTACAEDRRMLNVAAAATIWAISIWWWCRLLLNIRYDDPPGNLRCYNFFRKWIPRCLGALAFIVLAIAALQAGLYKLAVYSIIALIVYLAFVILRRSGTRAIARRLSVSRAMPLRSFAASIEPRRIDPESEPPYADLSEALGRTPQRTLSPGITIRLRPLIYWALILTFLLLAALGIFAPVWLGAHSGAMILFFIWGATWLPVGSTASYLADKCEIPLLSLLMIAALLFSFVNDNHEIRSIKAGVDIDQRKSVSRAMDEWASFNQASDKERTPFVIVATAGGGIRAAYWTATVLGNLHDHTAGFAQRTFALSGVSGGSVGATVYRALLEVPPGVIQNKCQKSVMGCAQSVLGEEFLGPVMAALLYPDLAQRFWPFPMFPDRGEALEKSWEAAFRKHIGDDRLNMSLASLSSQSPLPALFLNATWVDNGRRIVASNLRYAKEGSDETDFFIRSNDQLAVLRHDLRLSTAAHNSARFPFVSPPGMWKRDGKIAGRLQDGGLFENYGADTALEILDMACSKFSCDQDTVDKDSKSKLKRIEPIVILITSDPTLPEDLEKSPQNNKPSRFAYEIKTTLRAYERVRNGRGAEAAARLQEWADIYDGRFYQFRMCSAGADADSPPLGWALSKSAKKVINSYLFGSTDSGAPLPECYKDNAAASKAIVELLERP